MAITMQAGKFEHTMWIDLRQDGMMVECAVVKRDANDNIYYIELGHLDSIDKQRMARILTSRNVAAFPLWDLMSQTTLNNGVNALEYFHQLVKIISADGVIHNPRSGVIGTGRVQRTKTRAATKKAEAAANKAAEK